MIAMVQIGRTPVRRFGQWMAERIVQEAPRDIALCEFDCRKRQCTRAEWAACARRLENAAGELMPADVRAVH